MDELIRVSASGLSEANVQNNTSARGSIALLKNRETTGDFGVESTLFSEALSEVCRIW